MVAVPNHKATRPARSPLTFASYDAEALDLDLRWWSAANYLTVGQIYLRDNVLLRDPLTLDHVKPRLLGALGHQPRALDALHPAQPA